MRNLFHSLEPNQPPPEYPITTETEEPGQFYDGEAIPVSIEAVHATFTEQRAAVKASYSQITLQGSNASGPVLVVGRAPQRLQVTLIVPSTGKFVINKDPNSLNANIPIGAALLNSSDYTFKNQEEIYAINTGSSAAALSIVDEWYHR